MGNKTILKLFEYKCLSTKLSIDWTITIRIDKITTMRDYIDMVRQLWHIIVIEKKNSWVTIFIIQRKSWKYDNCMVFIAECIQSRANIEMNILHFCVQIYIFKPCLWDACSKLNSLLPFVKLSLTKNGSHDYVISEKWYISNIYLYKL